MDSEFWDDLNITDFSSFYEEDQKTTDLDILYWTFHVTFLIVGISGNSFVCILIATKRIMQTPVNLILANLALADLIGTLMVFIWEPLNDFASYLYITKSTCHMLWFFSMLSEYFDSIAIALPFIIFSFYQQISVRKCLVVILIHWVVTILQLIIPLDFEIFPSNGKVHCVLQPNTEMFFYEILHLINKILYPLLVTTCCLIIHKIMQKRFLKDKSLHRMLLLMVIISLIIWTPNAVFKTLAVFYDYYIPYKLFMPFHYFSYLDLVFKPILYIFVDPSFNKEFMNLISSCWNRRESEAYPLDTVNI